jgi:hypothetical protein
MGNRAQFLVDDRQPVKRIAPAVSKAFEDVGARCRAVFPIGELPRIWACVDRENSMSGARRVSVLLIRHLVVP